VVQTTLLLLKAVLGFPSVGRGVRCTQIPVDLPPIDLLAGTRVEESGEPARAVATTALAAFNGRGAGPPPRRTPY